MNATFKWMNGSRTRVWSIPTLLVALGGTAVSCGAETGRVFEVEADGASQIPLLDWRKWQISVNSSLHSDALQLRWFGKDNWADQVQPRKGVNLVQVDQSISISVGAADEGHQLAWTRRQLARLVMSEDTVRRMSQIDRGEFTTEDWRWAPELSLRGFYGEGLDWTYRSPGRSGWAWHGGAQLLGLKRLYGRELQGAVSYIARDQTYSFDAQSTQADSALKLPFQRPSGTDGQALLLKGRLAWQSPVMSLSAGVRDWGWVRWSGVPQQQLSLNSATTQKDANGFVIYKPLIQGQNSQSNLRWRTPWTLDVAAAWNVNTGQQLALLGEGVPNFGWLPSLRWSDTTNPFHWSLQWRRHQGDVLAQAQWLGWNVVTSTENFRRNARSQVWAVSYLHRF